MRTGWTRRRRRWVLPVLAFLEEGKERWLRIVHAQRLPSFVFAGPTAPDPTVLLIHVCPGAISRLPQEKERRKAELKAKRAAFRELLEHSK